MSPKTSSAEGAEDWTAALRARCLIVACNPSITPNRICRAFSAGVL